MTNSLIIFGNVNKRFILPLILSLAQITLILVNEYYPEKENNLVLQVYTRTNVDKIGTLYITYFK